jgi:hypothetical protein
VIKTFSKNGQLVDISENVGLRFKPNELPSDAARFTSDDPTVGRIAPVTITLDIESKFPRSGELEIKLGSTSLQMMNEAFITQIVDTASGESLAFTIQHTDELEILTIRPDRTYEEQISVRIDSVRNPASTKAVQDLQISTKDAFGFYIDKCAQVQYAAQISSLGPTQ